MRKIGRFITRTAAIAVILFAAKEVIAQGVAAGIKEARKK